MNSSYSSVLDLLYSLSNSMFLLSKVLFSICISETTLVQHIRQCNSSYSSCVQGFPRRVTVASKKFFWGCTGILANVQGGNWSPVMDMNQKYPWWGCFSHGAIFHATGLCYQIFVNCETHALLWWCKVAKNNEPV